MKAERVSSEFITVDDHAEVRLAEFSIIYEPFLGLAEYLLLALPAWMPSSELLDKLARQSARAVLPDAWLRPWIAAIQPYLHNGRRLPTKGGCAGN
jgi:hypothetical protein